MKDVKLIKTPEGVRDIWPLECERKLKLEQQLLDVCRRFAFRPMETPTFEFFDLFGNEIGTTPSKDLYKFFDREGNTLVLRPDVTPQIVRAAAACAGEKDKPLRICYRGNTYINHHSYTLRQKEITQIGAELMGEPGVHSDAEMIALAAECLLASGLTDFQIGIGHAESLAALNEAAGYTPEQSEEVRTLLANRNFFGVSEAVQKNRTEPDLAFLFDHLGDFYNSTEEMEELRQKAKSYPKVFQILSYFEELDRILELYGVRRFVTYELGMLPPFGYYTGIIFDGYTYDAPEPLMKGGRYDHLPEYFGMDEGAIGFAIRLDTLLKALNRQNKEQEKEEGIELILYHESCLEEAVKTAKKLRESGKRVELQEYRKEQDPSTLFRYASFTILEEKGK